MGALKLDAMARRAATLEVLLGEAALGELADLTLRIHLEQARSKGAVLSARQLRSYAEMSDVERAGLRSTLECMLKACVLLDLFEMPGQTNGG